MTSDLNIGGHKIINLEDPTSDSDAANPKSMLTFICTKLKFNQVITKMSLLF